MLFDLFSIVHSSASSDVVYASLPSATWGIVANHFVVVASLRDRKHVSKEPETRDYDLCFVREKGRLTSSARWLTCKCDRGNLFL